MFLISQKIVSDHCMELCDLQPNNLKKKTPQKYFKRYKKTLKYSKQNNKFIKAIFSTLY